MYSVTIRFYEELNDFLEASRRKQDIAAVFPERRSVKDLVESFGVPHVEVDLILVNGEKDLLEGEPLREACENGRDDT